MKSEQNKTQTPAIPLPQSNNYDKSVASIQFINVIVKDKFKTYLKVALNIKH